MPRISHSLPKYRKHRASGQAVVTLCSVDHYLGPHGTQASKRQYDRLIARVPPIDRPTKRKPWPRRKTRASKVLS